ncbi:MAG: glutathione S-transferase [Bdellovibrio sp.]|nr:glutathione S-transferase [Methylotenera sp.]
MTMPILYSYRRCPYAMRARMALKIAGIQVDIREISLRDKPAHMLQVSPKATVPVLVFSDGKVIDESMEIMFFSLKEHALISSIHAAGKALISENDGSFKLALDGYKYPEKLTEKTCLTHRQQGEVFLQKLENLLSQHPYLLKATPSLADIAIFPFIRQFAAVDAVWWESAPYTKLRSWLIGWVESEVFKSIMSKNPT